MVEMNLFLLYYDIVCYIFAVCVFIVCFVYLMVFWSMKNGGSIMYDSENQIVELVWTSIPTIVVLTLCILNVNFITNDLDSFSSETIKIVGHQWYWEYDTSQGSFESFVQCDNFIVDKPLRLIRGLPYHFIVTSADVIHSFHIPSLNLKMDAIPGRLNNLFFCPELYGTYIGYCAELCGVNHGIMPIVVEVVDN
uniref:Cytochrome c oxidase subunit 2 n=2 Tax=Rodentolepis nana TaxID=102285 RepID=A0A7R6PHI1_RODNA|nr:cytochrome c oxidase subunit 2 [Rodentolepis nana]